MYYFVLCVEGNPTERNGKTSLFVFVYVCQYVCVLYMYEYVVGTVYVWVSSIRPCVWPSWIGLFILLLHSGRCTVGLHRRRHGIRGVVVNMMYGVHSSKRLVLTRSGTVFLTL